MHIYVDADACPKGVKEILYRAAARAKVPLIMVSNLKLRLASSEYARVLDVPEGPDAADDQIAALVEKGDLVVTADIPLADRVVSREAFALDPRGDFYTPETVKQRLAVRNLMEHLRGIGMHTGGPAPFHKKDCMAFANQLDKFLAKNKNPQK
jgi:hypothetical protein